MQQQQQQQPPPPSYGAKTPYEELPADVKTRLLRINEWLDEHKELGRRVIDRIQQRATWMSGDVSSGIGGIGGARESTVKVHIDVLVARIQSAIVQTEGMSSDAVSSAGVQKAFKDGAVGEMLTETRSALFRLERLRATRTGGQGFPAGAPGEGGGAGGSAKRSPALFPSKFFRDRLAWCESSLLKLAEDAASLERVLGKGTRRPAGAALGGDEGGAPPRPRSNDPSVALEEQSRHIVALAGSLQAIEARWERVREWMLLALKRVSEERGVTGALPDPFQKDDETQQEMEHLREVFHQDVRDSRRLPLG